MRCKILLLMLAFSISASYAQDEKVRTKHFSFGLGTTYLTVRDISSSPLRYSGLGIQGQFGHEWEGPDHFQRLSLSLQAAGLNNSISYISNIMAYGGNLSYTYLHGLHRSENINWDLGGLVELWGNFRPNKPRDNNPLSYESGTSLSIATKLTKPLKVASNNLKFDFSLAVPVVSYLMRPAFGIPYPENYLQEGIYNPKDKGIAVPFVTSGKLSSFNQFFRIQSNLALTYPMKPGRAVRLGYNWDYYTINSVKRVQFADHSFMFSLLVNFNK